MMSHCNRYSSHAPSHLLLHFHPIFQIPYTCFQTPSVPSLSFISFLNSLFSTTHCSVLVCRFSFTFHSNFLTLFYFPTLQILRAKEVCIPEEHSICSTINSESDSEPDLNSPDAENYDGEEGGAGGESGGEAGGGGIGGRRGRGGGGGGGGGGGDMIVVSDRDYRDYDNGRNEELEGEIKWKGRGKRRSDEKIEGKGVFHGKKGRNKKKSGELWMKNQKNCVLQE
jgi:hypothetical protein